MNNVTLHTCTYFDPMIRFQLHPPAGPPESCESAAATVLIQGTQVQAQWCLIFHASSFIPPGRCRLVRGGRNLRAVKLLPQGRPSGRLRLQPAAAGAAAAAVALRASGGFPLLSLGSWQRLPAAQ
jgi:hypothetical protein